MKFTKLSLGLLLLAGLTLAGCSSSEESANQNNSGANKLTVYTTIYPLQDFAKKIGGEFVDVESIFPPNVDAHSFEPSTKDMMKLAEADLFIYSGAGIEGFAEKAEKSLKNEQVMIVKAAENVKMIESSHDHSHEGEDAQSEDEHHDEKASHSDEEHRDEEASHSGEEHRDEEASHSAGEHDNNKLDPHVWLDPILSIELASNIKDSLIELMPEREQEFEQNFGQLEQDLKKLDNEFKNVIDQAENKYLLVAHEAYGYWTNRYGITQVAVNGLSPTQEPSQRELKKLIEEAKEHDLKYIAFEQNVTSRVAEMIQREIGAKTVTLYNLESISEEDMKNQEDYFSLMQKNLQTLEKVLN